MTMTDLANTLHAYPSYSWAVQLMAADVYASKVAGLYRAVITPLERSFSFLRRLVPRASKPKGGE